VRLIHPSEEDCVHFMLAAKRSLATLMVVAIGALLALAPGAFAASPIQEGYNAPGGNAQAEVQPQAVTSARATHGGGDLLPFTGFDLALVLPVGAGLLLFGLGVRYLSMHGRQRDG
jgi:hypothetical protein